MTISQFALPTLSAGALAAAAVLYVGGSATTPADGVAAALAVIGAAVLWATRGSS